MHIPPDTAVLWALDAEPPGAQRIVDGQRTPAGALTTSLTGRVHETGHSLEQPHLVELGHHDIEATLDELATKGWAANNGGTPSRWIITPEGLDECERRRTGHT